MKTIPHNNDELPYVLCAKGLCLVLGISRASAYNLLHSQGFPTLLVGHRLMVSKEDLVSWKKRNTKPQLAD